MNPRTDTEDFPLSSPCCPVIVTWFEKGDLKTEFFQLKSNNDKKLLIETLSTIGHQPSQVVGVWPGEYKSDAFYFGSADTFKKRLSQQMAQKEKEETARLQAVEKNSQQNRLRILNDCGDEIVFYRNGLEVVHRETIPESCAFCPQISCQPRLRGTAYKFICKVDGEELSIENGGPILAWGCTLTHGVKKTKRKRARQPIDILESPFDEKKVLALAENCGSFKELADLLGIKYQTVSDYFNGWDKEDIKKKVQALFKSKRSKKE